MNSDQYSKLCHPVLLEISKNLTKLVELKKAEIEFATNRPYKFAEEVKKHETVRKTKAKA